MEGAEKDNKGQPVKDVKGEYVSLKMQKLSSALYLVTDFLSDHDPLKWKLRELSLEALINSAQDNKLFNRAIDVIGKMLPLFEVALANPGVSHMNFSILKQEYEQARNEMLKLGSSLPFASGELNGHEQVPQAPRAHALNSVNNKEPKESKGVSNPRRETILKYIKNHGWSSIKDIAGILPEVSSKTVQRELADLVQNGVLKREGDRRWSRYALAGEQA